jgi:hypothetical protein
VPPRALFTIFLQKIPSLYFVPNHSHFLKTNNNWFEAFNIFNHYQTKVAYKTRSKNPQIASSLRYPLFFSFTNSLTHFQIPLSWNPFSLFPSFPSQDESERWRFKWLPYFHFFLFNFLNLLGGKRSRRDCWIT